MICLNGSNDIFWWIYSNSDAPEAGVYIEVSATVLLFCGKVNLHIS